MAFVGDAHTTARNIASKLACPCGGALDIVGPCQRAGTISVELNFFCKECAALLIINTGREVRLRRALPRPGGLQPLHGRA